MYTLLKICFRISETTHTSSSMTKRVCQLSSCNPSNALFASTHAVSSALSWRCSSLTPSSASLDFDHTCSLPLRTLSSADPMHTYASPRAFNLSSTSFMSSSEVGSALLLLPPALVPGGGRAGNDVAALLTVGVA